MTISASPRQPPIPILEYIRRTWVVLTRSTRNLTAAIDPKFPSPPDGRWPIYVTKHEGVDRVQEELRGSMKGSEFQKIEIRFLPRDVLRVAAPGLLYLPRPYVVPGGRFNEMYGWDSFFIQMGLLRDGELALAKDMADNFLYEIQEYGKILNANRTYYLTRSQPPFLTEMLLATYHHTQDRKWLADSVPAIEKYYRYWTSEPHLTPETRLSRYYDLGEGPASEVTSSELDQKGRTDYDLVRQYFRTHRITDYDPSQYYDSAQDRLTELFYKGDRSMRESGFDPSNRFGPFSVDIIHYNPVCLNSLLYVMETQSAGIMDVLNRSKEAAKWRERAQERAETLNRLMWDPAHGLYFDYDFAHKRVRQYAFLTTFYPLWAGIASADQASRVVRNLSVFEAAGGLQTSTHHSGDQWDAPYGWAPLQWIAVEGLRRYGYRQEADRISKRFLKLVLQDYEKHGTIVEKYDVVHLRSDLGQGILFGYHSNEAGFGWTNAVFTALLDELPPKDQAALLGSAAKPHS
jgi:alpha,alpha-trehalase